MVSGGFVWAVGVCGGVEESNSVVSLAALRPAAAWHLTHAAKSASWLGHPARPRKLFVILTGFWRTVALLCIEECMRTAFAIVVPCHSLLPSQNANGQALAHPKPGPLHQCLRLRCAAKNHSRLQRNENSREFFYFARSSCRLPQPVTGVLNYATSFL